MRWDKEKALVALYTRAGYKTLNQKVTHWREFKVIQMGIAAVGFAVLFSSMFLLLIHLVGLGVAALTAVLVLDKIFGIHLQPAAAWF